MAQHSLGNFIGLTPDGRAIYSNVEWMKLDKKGNLHCGGENIFDFELNKFSMRGYQLRVEKHINPIYDVPAFLEINNSPHDVVRYEHQFVYAERLWLKEFLVQSGKERSLQFDWDTAASRTPAVYREVLETSRKK